MGVKRYRLAEIKGPFEDERGTHWLVRIAAPAKRDFGFWDRFRKGAGLDCLAAPKYLLREIEEAVK